VTSKVNTVQYDFTYSVPLKIYLTVIRKIPYVKLSVP